MSDRMYDRYVRFEDNIIRKHYADNGILDVEGAIKELHDNGYDRTRYGILRRLAMLRRIGFLPRGLDRRGGTKPVRCVETGIIYPSMLAAARALKLSCGDTIRRCCNGDKKTSAGYHWQYI